MDFDHVTENLVSNSSLISLMFPGGGPISQ